MAFEEIVEGIPLDILYPAKHRYHIEIIPQFKATLLSHSFSCIPRMPTVRGTKKDDHSIPLLSVVLEIICLEFFEMPKTNIG